MLNQIYTTLLIWPLQPVAGLGSANLRRHTSRAVSAWRQFRIPSVLRFSSTCLAQRWEAVLVCNIHHLAQIRRLYELGWSYPYERHDPAIKYVVFEYASLRRCHYIYRTAPGSIQCAILFYRRKVHKSYVGFSSRRRLMLAHLKMSAFRYQHHIIKPAI